MSELHAVLKKSFIFAPCSTKETNNGWEYDQEIGAWVDCSNKQVLLVASSDEKKPKPMSKKADRETGEDMKGG